MGWILSATTWDICLGKAMAMGFQPYAIVCSYAGGTDAMKRERNLAKSSIS